jgi:hypothetical protein
VVAYQAWSSLHLERSFRCLFRLSNAPLVRCGSACSKTWRCAACDQIRSTIMFVLCAASQPSSAAARYGNGRGYPPVSVHQRESGVQPPTINCSVSALRFFFTVTLDRPDLSRHLVLARYPRKLPAILSVEEVGRLLEATPGIKYKAILGTAYGAGLRVSAVASLKSLPQRRRGSMISTVRAYRDPGRTGQGTQGPQGHAVTQVACAVAAVVEGRQAALCHATSWLAVLRTQCHRSVLNPADQPRDR